MWTLEEVEVFALGLFLCPLEHIEAGIVEERCDVMIWNSLLCVEASESWAMIIRVLITAGLLRPELGCCVMSCGSLAVYTPLRVCVCIDVWLLLICAF